MRGELQVYASPDALAGALADVFVDCAREALERRGRFCVSLAGGTTPKAAYQLLAQEPRTSRIGWDKVFVYFGDERCVPPEDDRSNYKMARDGFLSCVPIPEANVHRMHGEYDPPQAARAYAEVLRSTLGERASFDLLLLGMGADGHTASLFPGADPLAEDAQLVRAVCAEKMSLWRLTITPSVINAALRIAVETQGKEKAAALAAALEGDYEPSRFPVQIVAPADGRLTWLSDAEAAANLGR